MSNDLQKPPQEDIIASASTITEEEIGIDESSEFEDELFMSLDDIYNTSDEAFGLILQNQDDLVVMFTSLVKMLSETSPMLSGYSQEDIDDLRIMVDSYTKILQSLLISNLLSPELRIGLAMGLKNLDVWSELEAAQQRMNLRDIEREKYQMLPASMGS